MKKKKNSEQSLSSYLSYKKIFLICITTLGILMIFACGFIFFLAQSIEGLGNSFSNSCEPEYPHSFEALARVDLPPNYDNFDSVCGGMQGWVAEATFTIDPNDLDLFLATTSIAQPLSKNFLPDSIYSFYFNTLENQPDNHLYGFYLNGADWLEEILVDVSDDEMWIVYFTVLAG